MSGIEFLSQNAGGGFPSTRADSSCRSRLGRFAVPDVIQHCFAPAVDVRELSVRDAVAFAGNVHDVIALAECRRLVRRQLAVAILFVGEDDDAICFMFAIARELEALREEDAAAAQSGGFLAHGIAERESTPRRN